MSISARPRSRARRIAAAFLAVVAAGSLLFGQDGGLRFDVISVNDGLSHFSLNDLVQDRQGFLWIATPDGLNRYDGYGISAFRHHPEDSTTLTANSINALHVDRRGRLWIGTFAGLNRYDRATGRMRQYLHDGDDPTSIPNDYVQSFAEDHDGRLWIGTANGLARYDPQRDAVERLSLDPAHPWPLLHPNITALCRDPRPGSGLIWAACGDAGLNRLDVATGRSTGFRHLPDSLAAAGTRYDPQLYAFLDSLAEAGHLLAALKASRDFSRRDTVFTLTRPAEAVAIAMGEAWTREVFDGGKLSDSDGGRTIWSWDWAASRHAGGHLKNRVRISPLTLNAGTFRLSVHSDGSHSPAAWNRPPPDYPQWWGIHLLRVDTALLERLKSLLEPLPPPDRPAANRISVLYPDSIRTDTGMRYLLWVGTRDRGLQRLLLPNDPDRDADALRVDALLPEGIGPDESGPRHIGALLSDGRGGLWIGTEGGGLYHLPSADGRDAMIRHRLPAEPGRDMGSHRIRRLLRDHSGLLWVATGNGLYKLNPRKTHLRHLGPQDGDGYGLPHGWVSALHTDGAGRVWIATAAGDLGRLDLVNGRYRPVDRPGGAGETPGFPISAITTIPGSPEDLWLGSGRHLFRYRIDKDEWRRYGLGDWPPAPPQQDDGINVLHGDRRGHLWIGTTRRGLLRFDPASGQVSTAAPAMGPGEGRPPRGVTVREVWSIAEAPGTGAPVLWVGTVGGGVLRYDTGSGAVSRFNERAGDSTAVNNRSIPSLHIDARGTVWVGTYSGGLNRFHPDGERFTHLTVREGLSNNMVKAILEDDRGRLWMSTNRGLTRYDPLAGEMRTYGVGDGLQSPIFNRGAATRLPDGQLVFGGIHGVNWFHPDSLRDNRRPPAVVITDFRVSEQPRPLYREQPQILAPHERSFSVAFVALDFTNPALNRYAYRLEGVDADWIPCGERRHAGYANLAPGRYTFRVRAANSDGVWNETGASLTVIVKAPFWRTGWFYMLVATVVTAGLYGLHAYRLRAQYRRLMDIERVRRKAAADFHDELGHKLTKVSLFAELIRRGNGEGGERLEYLDRISDISGSLYNGMRDFLWTLDPEKDTLQDIAIRLKDFGDEFFDGTGVQFSVTGIGAEPGRGRLSMDGKRHLLLLFKEAMTNVLRHAGAGTVLLSVAIRDGELDIRLRDDGRGYVPGNGSGEGQGIRNMRMRAERLGGRLTISGAPGGGTEVRFRGPLPAANAPSRGRVTSG